MRQFVTKVWRPAVAVFVGVLVTGGATYVLHQQWYHWGCSGHWGGIFAQPQSGDENYMFMCHWIRPLMWWVPAFWGGAAAGLVVGRRAWVSGICCGIVAVAGFTLAMYESFEPECGCHPFSLYISGYFRGWRENIALAYPIGATIGSAIAHWINWVRHQTKQKGLSHV